jgi:hypothetical protein
MRRSAIESKIIQGIGFGGEVQFNLRKEAG